MINGIPMKLFRATNETIQVIGMKLSRNINETIPSLDDGNPDTFSLILRRLNTVHQTMEPDAGVHHHTLHLVLAHQDAALGIIGIVAGMNADALETGNTLHIRQPLLESRRFGDEQTIRALGDGSTARNLSRHLSALSAEAGILLLRLQLHALQIAPRRLQGITEVALLRQLLQIKTMFETALVTGSLAANHLALHITISQQIKSADGISILLSYTL